MSFSTAVATPEQRDSLHVLVYAHWLVIGAILVTADYPLRSDTKAFLVVGVLLAFGVALNGMVHYKLVRNQDVALALPLSVGIFDALAITTVIGVIDSFQNPSFLLYYPALMAFSATFPGRLSLGYSAAVIGTYAALSVGAYDHFDHSSAVHWRALGMRTATLATVALIAYMLVRVERHRRLRAVAAERARQEEVRELQQQAVIREQHSARERARLVSDVHDGVSQGLYVLSLGLEGVTEQLSGRGLPAATVERAGALLRLSRQTLLDARGLLFDLDSVLTGRSSLEGLIRNQTDEFRAITGIPTSVGFSGQPLPLPPQSVSEIYRVLCEALANVYKHAPAGPVHVSLSSRPGQLVLEVSDQGDGFEPSVSSARGLGLRTMRERTERLGGTLTVQSAPGAGTLVSARIPVEVDRT